MCVCVCVCVCACVCVCVIVPLILSSECTFSAHCTFRWHSTYDCFPVFSSGKSFGVYTDISTQISRGFSRQNIEFVIIRLGTFTRD